MIALFVLLWLITDIHVATGICIACAKRNPQGKMIGIDRWGKE